MPTTLIIGTRTSKLALWQSNHVKAALEKNFPDLNCELQPFVTKGDKTLDKPLPAIGGKGLFTAELEAALHEGRIHLAVHSLKDLPTESSPGLEIGAILERANPGDVLISKNGGSLAQLPVGAIVGTCSLRRQAQLLALYPDLKVKPIRGNVDTRIKKVLDGQYDAAILAAAGVERLGLEHHISDHLPIGFMMPAPGQAALAVQCRGDATEIRQMLAAIHHADTAAAVTAERSFMATLGTGCSLPIAAYATVEEGEIFLSGLVGAIDGSHIIRVYGQGTDPEAVGQLVSAKAKAEGAEALLP